MLTVHCDQKNSYEITINGFGYLQGVLSQLFTVFTGMFERMLTVHCDQITRNSLNRTYSLNQSPK